MMEKQNVTLSIPKVLLGQAKIMAVSQDKSLSQLLKEALEEKVREEANYNNAQKRQLRLLKKGLDLGTVNTITDLWNSGMGVISTQVLQEFFVNVVQKIPKPIDKKLAKDIVRDFLKWHVVVNNGDSILDAIDICKKYRYSFWDSMIIEAAIKGGAVFLMSEDLQVIPSGPGMTAINIYQLLLRSIYFARREPTRSKASRPCGRRMIQG